MSESDYVVIDSFEYRVLSVLPVLDGRYRLEVWDPRNKERTIVFADTEEGPYQFTKPKPQSALWRDH